jgi:hypothetical protein
MAGWGAIICGCRACTHHRPVARILKSWRLLLCRGVWSRRLFFLQESEGWFRLHVQHVE